MKLIIEIYVLLYEHDEVERLYVDDDEIIDEIVAFEIQQLVDEVEVDDTKPIKIEKIDEVVDDEADEQNIDEVEPAIICLVVE